MYRKQLALFGGTRTSDSTSGGAAEKSRGWKSRLCVAAVMLLLAVSATTARGQTAQSLVGPITSQVSSGGSHTCALDPAGPVRCWGANGSGQLGDGTKTDRTTPVVVGGLSSDIVAISAGDTHTCALSKAGTVQCWGGNAGGKLGNGATTDSAVPVTVSGLDHVAAIAAGGTHTCALTSRGGAFCWGANDAGQLGNGTNTGSAMPVAVTTLGSGVTAIATGGAHSCAVLGASHRAQCWGANANGQLGNGTTTASNVPVSVNIAAAIDTIAAGGRHSCAGNWCWGANNAGQIGDGTTTDRPTPVNLSTCSGIFCTSPTYSEISLSTRGTCAHRYTNGAFGGSYQDIVCWGDNVPSPIPVPTLDRFDALNLAGACLVSPPSTAYCKPKLSAGGAHACAAMLDGTVKCWGGNSHGELGDGTTANSAAPVNVIGLAGDASYKVKAITTSGFHACLLTTTGGVKCWGDNSNGQLGTGASSSSLITKPVDVVGLSSGVMAISAAASHTCALLVGGTVKCWGVFYPYVYNSYGPIPVDIAGLVDIKSISTSDVVDCVVTNTGGVKCWGINQMGQLGNGTFVDSATPVDVVGLGSGITAVSASTDHVCALTATGRVKCWGHYFDGQLGNGVTGPWNTLDYLDSTWSESKPVDVVGLDAIPFPALAISGGIDASVSCALMGGPGELLCWGSNIIGQLNGKVRRPFWSGRPIEVLSGASAIATGSSGSCAITTGRTVKCWGHGSLGELGNGTLDVDDQGVVDVVNLNNVAAIAAGGSVRMALTYDNVIKWWGGNIVSTQAGAYSTVPVTFNFIGGAASQKLTLTGPTAMLSNDTALLSAQSNQGGAVTLDIWTPDTCSLNGTTLTAIKLGVCGVRASAPSFTDGSGNLYADAAQQYLLIPIVSPDAKTTTALSANPNPLLNGQNMTLTATVSGVGALSGTVKFEWVYQGQPLKTLCDAVPVSGNTAACTVPYDYATYGQGPMDLQATYSGDGTHTGSSATLRTMAITQLAITDIQPATTPARTYQLGAAVDVFVTLTAVNAGRDPEFGTITISDGEMSCNIPLNSTYPAPVQTTHHCSLTPQSAGARTITVKYSGSGIYAPSEAAPATITVVGPRVDGACGADSGRVLLASPLNVCSAGTVSGFTGDGHPWSWTCAGANGGSDATCSATLKTWTVTASGNSGGAITPAAQTIGNGRVATLDVTTADGFSVEVSGCGGILSADGKTYTTGAITADCAVTATFTANPVNGACGADNGQVLLATPTNLCSAGNASAVTGSGHPWSWICAGTNNGSTASCSATIKTWTVSASAGANGSIAPPSQNVDNGKTTTLTVAPATGYGALVSGCAGSLSADGKTYTTGTITADCAVTATFTANPVNGVCGVDNGQVLLATPTNLCGAGNASAVTGSGHPWSWTCVGANSGSTASCSATIKTWAVTASAAANGGIDPSSRIVDNGTTATFALSPANGYVVNNVEGSCGGTFTASNSMFVTGPVTTDCTVVANFKPAPVTTYTIASIANPPAGGSVDCNPVAVVSGGSSTCTATANAGYAFVSFSGDCGGTSPTCTLSNVTANKAVTANFQKAAPATFTVTPSVMGSGGTISPSTPQKVNANAAVTFTLAPANGYVVDHVEGTCGGSAGPLSFTTNPVTADCTVVAVYALPPRVETKTTLSLAPNPALANQRVTAAVTVTAIRRSAGSVTGTAVQATTAAKAPPSAVSTPTALPTVTVSGGGQSCVTVPTDNGNGSLIGSCVLTFAAPGSYAITANYPGDAQTLPSSDTQNLAVNAVVAQQAVPAPALSPWMLVLLGTILAGLSLRHACKYD